MKPILTPLGRRRGLAGSARSPSRLLTTLLLGTALASGAVSACAGTIVTMEYYVDSDPGRGKGIPLPPIDGAYDSRIETGQVTLDTTGLKPGPHLVHVRALGSNGIWGTYPPLLVYVYQRTGVIAAEYFLDTEPGLGRGTPLEPVDGNLGYLTEAITVQIPISGLARGGHTLYVRAKNSAGIWGTARALPFEVLSAINVAGAEYGFGGTGDVQPSGSTAPLEPADFSFDSPFEELVKFAVTAPTKIGTQRVFVRAKNSAGVWGNWVFADFRVTAGGDFDVWLDSFGLSGADRAAGADPDHDGLVNAVEYACNLNPTVGDRRVLEPGSGLKGLPHVSVTRTGVGSRLRVEFLRRKTASETAYLVKFCGNIGSGESWTPATGPETVTPIDGVWERVAIEDTAATGNETDRFGGVWIRFGP